jgi:hypothetical protein
MGSTSRVTNYDRFIHETRKGVASVKNVWDNDQAPIEPFVGHLGWIRERLEDVRQPLSYAQGMEVSPVLPCGYNCTPLQSLKAWSPSRRIHSVVLTFYTHGREMMEHDDIVAYMQ